MKDVKVIELPYSKDALDPLMSSKTVDFHYEKHHKGYMKKLEGMIEADSSLQGKNLEELVKTTSGGVFNNAAQIWNHNCYWLSISPSASQPSGEAEAEITKAFGSYDDFSKKFVEKAMGQFGSGWAWLSWSNGKLDISTTTNAENPLQKNEYPLFTLDLWEHAFYLDYQNDKKSFYDKFMNQINWDFVNQRLNEAKA